MNHKKKIAIIGGGIAGLTFARCLSSENHEIHIFEKKDQFGEIGAAISVFPNALCVMEKIGLLNDILNSSGHFIKVYLKTDKGVILTETESKSDYPVVCIHRANLHSILLKDIDANLYKDYALKSITHQENGQINLEFTNGEKMQFDAVIGADGVHSAVRKDIINDGEPIFRGYNIWRGVVKTNFDIGHASETFGKGKRVGIVPIKDGVYGWWATYNEEFMKDDQPEGTKEKLNRLFGDWHYPIPDLINNTELILKNSLIDRKPHRGWSKGNAVLIGDAAHPTTPNLGQGGCMAIEGAFILAESIKKYGLTKKAFDRYEELHYPRAENINKESLKLGKIGQITNPVLIFFRNLVFKLMPSKRAIKILDKYFSYRVTKLEI
jgi:2-polyprenyl-6-methoxyphenol hydroxylase-like FAD-dependent oxidoreductase